MKQVDRQKVSREYNIMDNQLKSIMYYLSNIRNFCAHGNRLYCFRSKQSLITMPIHSILRDDNKIYGKYDLFAAVVSLKYLLPNDVFKCFINDIKLAFNNFMSNATVITEEALCHSMGFCKNWETILL